MSRIASFGSFGSSGRALAMSLAAAAGAAAVALACAVPGGKAPLEVASPAPETQQVAAPAEAEAGAAAAEPVEADAARGDGGWGYLIDKLVQDGISRERALRTFQDPRVEPFDGLGFSLDPKESRALYRNFLKAGSVSRARRCREEYATAFDNAERQHRVPASVVAAILHVETGCGQNTGSSVILWRLARLAMANEPANLEMNLARNATVKGVRNATLEKRTRERAKYLEDLFYPEVLATFTVADRKGIDPLEILGSGSGAFGYPQFLPTSFLRYGVDGNGDGAVSLYDLDDAASSAANYLAQFGWKPGISAAQKRKVIWHYNRSDAYIDAVLGLAGRLDAKPGAAKAASKPSRKRAAEARRVASGG